MNKLLSKNESYNFIKEEKFRIAAMLPQYCNDGKDISEIILVDNTTVLAKISISTLLSKYAREFSYTIEGLQSYYQEELEQSIVSYPISHNILLVPLRTRTTNKKQHKAYGRVNFYCVNGTRTIPGKGLHLIINGSKEIKLNQGKKTTKKALLTGIAAGQHSRINYNSPCNCCDPYPEFRHYKTIKLEK